MFSQFTHFISTSAGVALVILLGAFGLLSSDPTAFGVIANALGVFVAILTIGIAVSALMRVFLKKTAVSIGQIVQNAALLSITVVSFFYWILAYLFDWPTNLVRVMPVNHNYEPSHVTVALSALLPLITLLTWTGWTVWLAVRGTKPKAPPANL